VVADLFARVHLPDDDPRKIRTVGQLVPYFPAIGSTGYDWLKNELDRRETPEGQRLSDVRTRFYNAMKPQFDKSTFLTVDEKGGEDNFRFWQYAQEQERIYTSTPGKDAYDLYNYKHPDYLGKKVPAFKRSLDEQIRGMAESLRQQSATRPPAPAIPGAPATTTPAAPAAKDAARRPGETIEEYRKRRGLP